MNYPRGTTTVANGLSLGSVGSVLELAGVGSNRLGGSFPQLLTEAPPDPPLLPKHCHINPMLLYE